MTPMTARLAGLLEMASPAWCSAMVAGLALRRLRYGSGPEAAEAAGDVALASEIASAMPELRAAIALQPELLARIAALESVSLASIPFRVEAVAHLEAQERYREHRHGEPDTTEKMLRAALNVIRDMDNAARAALTLKENEDV